jgi:hypothetical protein
VRVHPRSQRRTPGVTARTRCNRGRSTVRVKDVSSPPLWMLALVVAAVAPWTARALQLVLERRVRRRTLDLVAKALPGWERGKP